MNNKSNKVGLVLSGGGAQGAYQVGMIKCLADMNISVDAVAGSSVGAFNGAVISAESNLRTASNYLEEIWYSLASECPIKIKGLEISAYLGLLLINSFLPLMATEASSVNALSIISEFQNLYFQNISLFEESPVQQLLENFIELPKLQEGLPLYISLCRSQGNWLDVLSGILSAINLLDTPSAEFVHIQSLKLEEQMNAILASAAIPLLFEAKQIQGGDYVAGSIGGTKVYQGNTPINPLIKREKCTHIIVNHLSDGSLWDRHNFPDVTILEIRPGRTIQRQGLIKDTLAFDAASIQSWINQGYEDTQRCLKSFGTALSVYFRVVEAGMEREKAVDRLDNDNFNIPK